MEEATENVPILALWHGRWYLATRPNADQISFHQPAGHRMAVWPIINGISVKRYPEDLAGNALKSSPSQNVIKKGDNVLARIRHNKGYTTTSKQLGYEMGFVLETTFKGSAKDVLIEFQYGVREVVPCDRICHMYLGGPTRLNHLAQGLYPDHRSGTVSTASSSELFVSPLASTGTADVESGPRVSQTDQRTQKNNNLDWTSLRLGSVAEMNTAMRNYLADLTFITKCPWSRKAFIARCSESFRGCSKEVEASQEGMDFKRLWAQLVRHHHHNVVVGCKARIYGRLHREWFDL